MAPASPQTFPVIRPHDWLKVAVGGLVGSLARGPGVGLGAVRRLMAGVFATTGR